jgi:hypothetical protein
MKGSASAERVQSLQEQSLNKAEDGSLIARPTKIQKVRSVSAQRSDVFALAVGPVCSSRCEDGMNVKLHLS